MNTKLFSELGLSAELLKAIDKLGFEKASPVQAEAIPLLLAGRDVVGQSQTGSGKTAAFMRSPPTGLRPVVGDAERTGLGEHRKTASRGRIEKDVVAGVAELVVRRQPHDHRVPGADRI